MLGGYILLASFAMSALIAGYYQLGCDRVTAVVTAHGGHNDGSWIWSLGVTRTDSGEDIGYVIHWQRLPWVTSWRSLSTRAAGSLP